MKYLLTLIILILASCSTALEQNSQWHWERLDEYTKFRKGEIQREEYKGYTYFDGEPDISPTLHYLTKMSEITHVDLTFPRVKKTPEVTNFWMEKLSKIDGLIDVHGNHEYVDFKTSGLQPLRLKIWFKPKAKKEIQQFIKAVENKFTPELKVTPFQRVPLPVLSLKEINKRVSKIKLGMTRKEVEKQLDPNNSIHIFPSITTNLGGNKSSIYRISNSYSVTIGFDSTGDPEFSKRDFDSNRHNKVTALPKVIKNIF